METDYFRKIYESGPQQYLFLLVMDHGHVDGFYRSLLCAQCNMKDSLLSRTTSPQCQMYPEPRRPPMDGNA